MLLADRFDPRRFVVYKMYIVLDLPFAHARVYDDTLPPQSEHCDDGTF